MSILDRFVRGDGTPLNDAARISFGFRGEGVNYQRQGNRLVVDFTWIGGPRVYPDSITKWSGGSALTDDEKITLFREVLQFVTVEEAPPTVVINSDAPSRTLWEQVCASNAALVAAIEYTSDETERARERDMYLSTLRAGRELSVDGVDIRDEHDLDRVLQRRRRRSP
jgi:hypothetical protein